MLLVVTSGSYPSSGVLASSLLHTMWVLATGPLHLTFFDRQRIQVGPLKGTIRAQLNDPQHGPLPSLSLLASCIRLPQVVYRPILQTIQLFRQCIVVSFRVMRVLASQPQIRPGRGRSAGEKMYDLECVETCEFSARINQF